jgi:hypothetical protein
MPIWDTFSTTALRLRTFATASTPWLWFLPLPTAARHNGHVESDDRDPVVQAYKAGIDRTLYRENPKLTVEERFRKAMELQRFADELRRAGRRARAGRPVLPDEPT